MTVHHGNSGAVKIGSNAVAEIQSFTYEEEDVSPAEITSMGDTTATPLPSGCKRGKGTIATLTDQADTTGQAALRAAVANGTPVTLHLYEEGEGGTNELTGSVYLRKSSRGSDKTKPNESSFEYDGVLTEQSIT